MVKLIHFLKLMLNASNTLCIFIRGIVEMLIYSQHAYLHIVFFLHSPWVLMKILTVFCKACHVWGNFIIKLVLHTAFLCIPGFIDHLINLKKNSDLKHLISEQNGSELT